MCWAKILFLWEKRMGNRDQHILQQNNILHTGKIKGKGSEEGKTLTCLRKRKKASVTERWFKSWGERLWVQGGRQRPEEVRIFKPWWGFHSKCNWNPWEAFQQGTDLTILTSSSVPFLSSVIKPTLMKSSPPLTSSCLCAWLLGHVRLFANLWTIAHQALLSMDSSGKNTRGVAISPSRGSSWPRDWTHDSCVFCIAGGFFTHWTTGEAHHRDM